MSHAAQIKELQEKIRPLLYEGKGMRVCDFKVHLPASSDEDIKAAADALVKACEAFSYQVANQIFYLLERKCVAKIP